MPNIKPKCNSNFRSISVTAFQSMHYQIFVKTLKNVITMLKSSMYMYYMLISSIPD